MLKLCFFFFFLVSSFSSYSIVIYMILSCLPNLLFLVFFLDFLLSYFLTFFFIARWDYLQLACFRSPQGCQGVISDISPIGRKLCSSSPATTPVVASLISSSLTGRCSFINNNNDREWYPEYQRGCLACLPTYFRSLGWTNLTRPFLATRSFLPSSGTHYCSTYNQKGTNN